MPVIYLCFLSNLTKMTSKGLQKSYIFKDQENGSGDNTNKILNFAKQTDEQPIYPTKENKTRLETDLQCIFLGSLWDWGELDLRGEEHEG